MMIVFESLPEWLNWVILVGTSIGLIVYAILVAGGKIECGEGGGWE